jgi:hypothetical protein
MSVPDTFCFFVFFVGEDNGEPGCDGVPSQPVTGNESERTRIPTRFRFDKASPWSFTAEEALLAT